MKRVAWYSGVMLMVWMAHAEEETQNDPFALPPELHSGMQTDKKIIVPEKQSDNQKEPVVIDQQTLPPISAPVTSKMQPSEEKFESKSGYKRVDKAAQVTSGIDFKRMEEDNEDVVDTVNAKATSGNWVFKNYWWRKIEDLYSQIKEAFNAVMSTRMNFFTQRSEVDKELDRFYQHVGIEQGPLEDIINLGLEVMEKEKKEQGYLNKKEQQFFDKIQNKQHQFEQLKKDVKAIEELDANIDQALETVLQQVDICNKYEQQAWQSFKNVARELSDKEARKQYYQTKALLADINNVNNYLNGEFSNYFNQMTQGLQEHTQNIVAKLAALKADGIDLQKEIEFFEQEDEDLVKEAQAKKQAEHAKEIADKKSMHHDDTQKHEETFFRKTVNYFAKYWDTVMLYWYQMLESVKGLFGGSVKKVKAVEREVAEKIEHEVDEVQKELGKVD